MPRNRELKNLPRPDKHCPLPANGLRDDGSQLTPDELEFGEAMRKWREDHGRRFPLNAEMLALLRSLGYRKELNGPRDDGSQLPPEEIELDSALEKWRRDHRRQFPRNSEVLALLRGLGYEKVKGATG